MVNGFLTRTEPVRLYLYSLLVPLTALLVVYGWVDSNAVPVWIAVASAALGFPAVEFARAQVASPKTQADLVHGGVKGLEEAGYTVVPPIDSI